MRTIAGKKLAGLLGQIQQDGRAVEYPNVAIDDHRYLGIGIESDELGAELFALAGIDRDGFIWQSGLLQEQRHFGGIGRGIEVEFQHRTFLLSAFSVRSVINLGRKSFECAAQKPDDRRALQRVHCTALRPQTIKPATATLQSCLEMYCISRRHDTRDAVSAEIARRSVRRGS